MYLHHFGLHSTPFSLSPHPEFFYAGARRGATLEALCYAILQGEGIVKVTGEVGSGKTMLHTTAIFLPAAVSRASLPFIMTG